jgi:hypothetical protein
VTRACTAPKPAAAAESVTTEIVSGLCDDLAGLGHRVRLAAGLLEMLSLDAPPDRPTDPAAYQQQATWAQAGFLADTLAELGERISEKAETVRYSVGGDQ